MTEIESKKIIDELISLELQKNKVKYSFHSKLTPIVLGFLGLLVSLKSKDNSSEFSQYVFFQPYYYLDSVSFPLLQFNIPNCTTQTNQLKTTRKKSKNICQINLEKSQYM